MAKATRLRAARVADRWLFPWPKLCSRLYPLVLRTLKVSFSIFHLARPASAIASTLLALTGRSVTKLFRYVTSPFALRMVSSNQLTISASSPSRIGMAFIQRQAWVARCLPRLTRFDREAISAPVRYSYNVLWLSGLQTNRKCPPLARIASHKG